jgi:iron(III) transport system substrate-binding protein
MRLWPFLVALAVVVLGPIALRPKGDEAILRGQDRVIAITPHNEAIRAEFGRGFREWYHARAGRTVTVDFRSPGGTTEITRYLGGGYYAAFQQYWQHTSGRAWTSEVEAGWADAKINPDNTPENDTPAEAARRAFLASNVSSGIDVFFGGGSYDFQKTAGQGFLVDSGYVSAHPELFGTAIPLVVGGEPYFDPKGRWMGSTIGAFGIAYNRDQLTRLRIPEPRTWGDLADPSYFHGLALANPTQSSSANKAFEMLIQQQINEEVTARAGGRAVTPEIESAALEAGWIDAMRLLQKIAGNARYFSDSSAKISLDVESGEAVAGMTIDFYGRFQSEAVRRRDGSSRIGYVNAEGGTSFGVDPIGLLRGAPNREVALAFIDYVMGDGQKLWGWRPGTPGGPRQYALRRLPILPDLYGEQYRQFRSDPEVFPYEAAKSFTYVEARTGRLFSAIGFIIRVMCIDAHKELKAAWAELNAAKARLGHYPTEALAAFEDVSRVDYATAKGRIREATGNSNKLDQVQLAKELADVFRANYERAAELARQGR